MAAMPMSRQVSSSAPPSYRAKKVKPMETDKRPDNPRAQNADRMTGSPMQKGAGAGSMFANGRMGQPQGMMPKSPEMGARGPGMMRPAHGQPQGAPPRSPNMPQARMGPARPMGQAQGGHPRGVPTATHMMADGDSGMFGDTPPIGGMPDDEGMDQAAMPGDGSASPEPMPAGGGSQLPMIKPEAVAYHDDPHACQLCQYMGPDGNCAVLQMQVSPDGGCTAFEAGSGSGMGDNDGDEGMPTGAGFTQNDAGTSGAPPLG